MCTHLKVIERLGGPHQLARQLSVKPVTARAWAIRGQIPAKYWPAIARVPDKDGLTVSIEELAQAVAAPTQSEAA
jgi:DNA-binding transcriptional regulator YdaS (Cro superfamily)